MPIWSLTAERLDKLREAIAKKKTEHDILLAKSEKDLWCADLDEFVAEWENQLAIDAEIQTNIRRMGRRVSKKIGAGGRGRKAKGDDDYEPGKKGRGKAKDVVKAEPKSSQRFAAMFSSKPEPKKEPVEPVAQLSDDFSDEDFAALSRSKPVAVKQSGSQPPTERLSEEPVTGRAKRAAASKAKALFDMSSDSDDDIGAGSGGARKASDDDDDDDKMLGDIGAMVKGIGKSEGKSSGRLSLYAMNRPESAHGGGSGPSGLPKLKTKASKSSFDVDSPDETNYEMLAKSSPHKTAKREDVDSFLSDDEPIVPPKALATKTSTSGTAESALTKQARGGGTKKATKADTKSKEAGSGSTKTATSAAAKGAGARKGAKKGGALEESDSEEDGVSAWVPKAAGRSRPGRAAAARRPVIIAGDDSEEEDDDSDQAFNEDDDSDD